MENQPIRRGCYTVIWANYSQSRALSLVWWEEERIREIKKSLCLHNVLKWTKKPQTRKNHKFTEQQHSEWTISSDKRASRNLMENMRLYPPGPRRQRIKLQFVNLLFIKISHHVFRRSWSTGGWTATRWSLAAGCGSFLNLSIFSFTSFFSGHTPRSVNTRRLWTTIVEQLWGVIFFTSSWLILTLSTFMVNSLKGRVLGIVHITDKRWKENFYRKHNPNQSKKFLFSNKIQLSNFDKLFSA